MPRAGTGQPRRATGSGKVGGPEGVTSAGPRPLLSLSRWMQPRLQESVSRVLLYEPAHPLNVFAQHLYYAQILLSAPLHSPNGVSAAALSSSLSAAEQDPFRCFTGPAFLRARLTPYGVEALATAVLPGWGCTTASSSGEDGADEQTLSVAERQRRLDEQHSTVAALLRCQDRATAAERDFVAASEASNQAPVTPLFFSEEGEVTIDTVAAFCAAWVEQELQFELPGGLTPDVAFPTILILLSQLDALLSSEAVKREGKRASSTIEPAPTSGPPSLSSAAPSETHIAVTPPDTICAWVCVLSQLQVEHLYAYLFCRIARRAHARPPPLPSQSDLPAREAMRSLISMVDRLTASLHSADEAPAISPACLLRLLSCSAPLLASIVHVAVPLCQWMSCDAWDESISSPSTFLGCSLPQLVSAISHGIRSRQQSSSTAPPILTVTPTSVFLPASMAGFPLCDALARVVGLAGSLADVACSGDENSLSPFSLSQFVSNAAEAATRSGENSLGQEERWRWVCFCFLAAWEAFILPDLVAIALKQE